MTRLSDTEVETSSPAFQLPPVTHTVTGAWRRAGFELEFAGLTIEQSARIVRQTFGGEVEIDSTFATRVRSPVGTFKVEIDAILLREKKYEGLLRAIGYDPDSRDTRWLEEALLGAAATIVPIEVAAPPIPINELGALEELRERLRDAGARGTSASLLYAFGMHVNPELSDARDARSILDQLRAFLLLYPWLRDRVELDLTRRMSPFVNPFPAEYVRLVLQPDYPATAERLIDDYLTHNPTRNRALDMLPALAYLNEELVKGRADAPHLVQPRPSLHYRLPNCLIDEPSWTLAREWNTWLAVERLAQDQSKLARMSREYLKADGNALRPIIDQWPKALGKWVREVEG